jgi:hypothetical protein
MPAQAGIQYGRGGREKQRLLWKLDQPPSQVMTDRGAI